ncbi:thioredoxin family protein [Candidatus Marinamargulisbacteria bacterium SCGC AG-414-C22]|nr:thioredoxin family protein [Candidatus Marinamargulisbacteria bacterium SCGC AG-414-C22]
MKKNKKPKQTQAQTQTQLKPTAALNQPAPDFTGIDSNGISHKLSGYKGKLVVLEWKNSDCPFVKKHYGANNMQTLQKTYTDQGVIWLSIISSAPQKQGHVSGRESNDIVKAEQSAATAVILDETGVIGRLYDAKTTPHMYIINKEGQLVYNGAIDSNSSADPADIETATNYVATALTELLAGKTVSTQTTRAYGCSVKY